MKKSLLLAALAVSLSGCAGLKFQWSASYQTENLAAELAAIRAVQEQPQKPISYSIAK